MSHLDFVVKLLNVGIHAGQLFLVWLQVRLLLNKQTRKQRRIKRKNRRG